MDYLRSTADLLADQIRAAIERGELTNPLPSIRDWSRKLSVSRTTLGLALKKLAAAGLLEIHPRKGARIRAHPKSTRRLDGQTRLVRTLYCGRDYPLLPSDMDWLIYLSEQLQQHEIHLTLERCTDGRLRAIARRGERPDEMFLLLSVPAAHQRRFARLAHSTLLLGMPAPRVGLPSVGTDLAGIIRHAALTLMQHGFTNLSLMTDASRAVGVQQAADVFLATCSEWQRAPVQAEVVRIPLVEEAMALAARRFASRITQRHGLVVIRPVSLAAVLTALLMRGIAIPDQVEVVGIESTLHTVKSCPSVSHYPFPVQEQVKSVTEAALTYFETGKLPNIHKLMLTERVPAQRGRSA
jgi:DNA-binding LacI/PurR family transcriptional regulator